MLKIDRLYVEDSLTPIVSDVTSPSVRFTLTSDKAESELKNATVSLSNGESFSLGKTSSGRVSFTKLQPFTVYRLTVVVEDSLGEKAEKSIVFETGRLSTPWEGKWITDTAYSFTEKKVSPKPISFFKSFETKGVVRRACIYATALGLYQFDLNGKPVGDRYLTPGFTSYKSQLLYQSYDITSLLKKENHLEAHLGGGWAVGSYVMNRVNRVTAPRQALLAEIRITYEDGSVETLGTDPSWLLYESPYKEIDIYDGETFDARIDPLKADKRPSGVESVKINPSIEADYGVAVKNQIKMEPISKTVLQDGTIVYDFGQNFAGVVHAEIKNAKEGQQIEFTHAEILKADGSLNRALLRSAKAHALYIAKEGKQTYEPRMSYMGFRYVGVTGIEEKDIELYAYARFSDIEQTGDFACSNEKLNRLQQNILWSSRSNFVEIPTDCPQRDERMGWTGDIALFAKTAAWNFDTPRFLKKWLRDLRSEQLKTGGVPNTIPNQGYGFPVTMPKMAIDFWGDASVLVPYSLYEHYGDEEILKISYPSMVKYAKAEKFWANIWGLGKYRYIWHTPALFHFGDWVSPDEPKMSGWQARSRYTATASLFHMSDLVSKAATILDKKEDAAFFAKVAKKTRNAYNSVFFDKDYQIKKKPFQTAYVLPLYFNMVEGEQKQKAADHLAELAKANDYTIGTGFPGTPYILFALADNGHLEEAYKMLLCEKSPSWLYEVKMGGTTIWERFDAIKEGGEGNLGQDDGTGGMVSFNHYASGAVGDFFYRRILGIEEIEPGYRSFRFAPAFGGDITSAKGHTLTPYGTIEASWKKEGDLLKADIAVPYGATCEVKVGEPKTLKQGKHHLEIKL